MLMELEWWGRMWERIYLCRKFVECFFHFVLIRIEKILFLEVWVEMKGFARWLDLKGLFCMKFILIWLKRELLQIVRYSLICHIVLSFINNDPEVRFSVISRSYTTQCLLTGAKPKMLSPLWIKLSNLWLIFWCFCVEFLWIFLKYKPVQKT